MTRLGFPSQFVDCVYKLFFGNQVRININGYFTDEVIQQRGLRQGDPLWPLLLFNLALEPFILSILQDPLLPGISIAGAPRTPPGTCIQPPPLKCLAYADDVCLFLSHPDEIQRAHYHMQLYAQVSNAKFNDHKIEAFSIRGPWDSSWNEAMHSLNITTFHHQGSVKPFRYLGFYLPYNDRQQKVIETQLLDSVKTQCLLYSKRQLSILGRVTVMNILILSTIWYTLRLMNPRKGFFKQLRSIIYQFIWQNKSHKLKLESIFLPYRYGGLIVLDPILQHQVLQKRWLNYLLEGGLYPSFVYGASQL